MTVSRPERSRITLFELMALIAGLAVGLWIILPTLRQVERPMGDSVGDSYFATASFLLGGLSLVGPPLLIFERRRRKQPFGPGRMLWFSQGMAAWLLWPPVVDTRIRAGDAGHSTAAGCFVYGTPLMAIYVLSALLVGGRLGKRRRKVMKRSFREKFGLGLALVWACLGLYVLAIFYREDFRR